MMWSTASIGPWSIADEQHYDPYPTTPHNRALRHRGRSEHYIVELPQNLKQAEFTIIAGSTPKISAYCGELGFTHS